MSNYISIIAVCLATSMATQTVGQSNDLVERAHESNEKKADKGVVNESDAEFLVRSTDARMMDYREGKLAADRGTTAPIKEYGELMMEDQNMLLDKIRTLASAKKVTLPTNISDKKEKGREDLAASKGKDFDKKFVQMMIIDHERDVKLFKKARNSKDKDISSFASQYLPLIESHLKKIKDIKGTMK